MFHPDIVVTEDLGQTRRLRRKKDIAAFATPYTGIVASITNLNTSCTWQDEDEESHETWARIIVKPNLYVRTRFRLSCRIRSGRKKKNVPMYEGTFFDGQEQYTVQDVDNFERWIERRLGNRNVTVNHQSC